MIIERLDLKAFGPFTDVSLDLSAGPRRFHLIYGPNESGKSTTLRAITGWLFGMPHLGEDNYLHNNAQLRVGGVLADDHGNTLQCYRRRGRKGTLRDAHDADPIDEARLHTMLGGIDRATFLSRFGLSHDELVAGGAAILDGENDLGKILFAAGAGVSQLRSIGAQLDQQREKLFTPRGNKSINTALRELDEKRKELRQSQIAPSEFSELKQRLQDKRDATEELSRAMQEIVVELAKLRSYEQALPLVSPWRSAIRSLTELSNTPLLDEGFTERRRQLQSDRDIATTRLAELTQRRDELASRLQALPEDRLVMNHESEIQAVFQEVAARDKADRDRIELIRVQQRTDRKVIDLLRELSVEILSGNETETADAINDSVDRLRISDALRTRLHELAAQFERLTQQRDDSSGEVEILKKRLADATREWETISTPADSTSLDSVIDSIGPPSALLESQQQQQENCERLQRRCQNLLRRLDGFDGSFQQAAQLPPPSASVMSRLSKHLQSGQERVDAANQRLTTLREQHEQANRQLTAEQSGEPLPTAEQWQQARAERDQLADEISECAKAGEIPSRQLVDRLQAQIRGADQLVDTMWRHHEQVYRRAAELSSLQSLQQQVAQAATELDEVSEALRVAEKQWQTLWLACGVVAGTPDQMQRWLVDHEQLVEAAQSWDEESKRLEHLQQRSQRACLRLRAALDAVKSAKAIAVGASFVQAGLFDELPQQDLTTLYDEAVATRSELIRERHQHESLTRRRDELAEELPQAETRLLSRQKSLQTWHDDWTRATQSFADGDNATPTVIMSMLRRIDELCERKRERDILATRIRSIREDELAFAGRVQRLGNALDIDQPGKECQPGALAHTMYQRLQAERTASKQRDTLRVEIEDTTQRLAEVDRQLGEHQVALKQLCAEVGCDAVDQLPEIERRSRDRQQVQASLRDLENQLTILCDDESIEQFVESVSSQQPALLEVNIQQKEADLNEIRGKIATTQQQVGVLQHELDLMDGSGRASDVRQSVQLLVGQMSRDVEEFARLNVASLLLRNAIDHYRRANQSPVLAHAERIFRRLTCGEYQSLKVDFDAKGKSILFGVRPGADSLDVPTSAMSTGTADALYLALRLASLHHQLGHGHPIPVVVDDCLIQLDDDRAAAAMSDLSELSLHTQVILFTHHQHLVELAESRLQAGEYHLHRLSLPAC